MPIEKSAAIWSRRCCALGAAVLGATALGFVPIASAEPAPGCPQGRPPGPGPGCGLRAFVADVRSAGIEDSNGNTVELDEGLDICSVMDTGISRDAMVSQFAALNPGLGVDGSAQVVRIAVRDLCPWHS